LPEEDEEVSVYFKTKPENQVVKLGEPMKVECTFKKKPPSVDWYRGAIPVKTDPRCTLSFDEKKLVAIMELKKCKITDEAKFRVQVEDAEGEEMLEFAGFSVFVKDPKDSGLDFRNLLRHKDHKKRRGTKEDPDWGELNPLEKEHQEYQRNRRMSAIDLSRGTRAGQEKEKSDSFWIDPLEDVTCQDKEAKVELACRFSKPSARVHWYKNKLEIFQGPKYNMSADGGIFRLVVHRVGLEDAGKYTCEADLKETSSYLIVEGKKITFFFTQKLPKTVPAKRKKDQVLECMLNDPRASVTWTKNGEKIEYTPGKYEISRRENRCILKIQNVGKDDAGDFVCHVEGDETSCHVTIEEPEYDFDKKLTDADAYEKETAEFECEVNDEDAPVQWFREDKPIDMNDPKFFCVQDGKKRRLRVNNISSKDEGIYKCKVQGKETSAKLYVAPEVVIKEQLKNVRKVEGEVAKMQCKVKNPKNYPIRWFKDGEEIKFPSDKYEVTEENGKQTLIIKDLKLGDAGEFSCKIGDRETSAQLQVDEGQRPPVINLEAVPREITVKAGRNVALQIPYTAHPVPTSKWFRDNKPLLKDDHIGVSQAPEMCKLNITKAKREDAGEYVLELENDCGKHSVPITIKVVDKPGIPEGPLQVLDIYRDHCRLAWKPPLDDGGLPIQKYIVEAQDMDSQKWVRVGRVVGDTQCGVPGLEPGKKYKFRVKACNAEGESDPLVVDEAILAKDPFDPPGKPGRPEIVDYDKNNAEIKWDHPKSDGGSPLTKYVIEKRPKGGYWEKVGMVPAEETSAVVPGLDEGKEYDFRVVPVNEAGPGEVSDPSDMLYMKARRVKPVIDRDSFNEVVQIKAGQDFTINVKFFGEPPPKPTWSRGGKPLPGEAAERITLSESKSAEPIAPGENVKFTGDEFTSTISCKGAGRKDTNKYKIVVTNDYGSDSAEIEVIVLGPPGRPEGPLEVVDVQKDSVTIAWEPPKDDGGKPLTGYSIEKMNPKTGKWEKLLTSIPPNVKQFKVPKLKEGDEYQFRVRAENDIGTSEPLDTTKATKVKNPFDPTDPPGKPEVVDSDKNFIKIKWEKPKRDGGAPVNGYNIERKDPRTGVWTRVNDEPIKGTEFTDDKVQPNKEYQYRVTAENEGGESNPSEPSDIIKARPLREAPKLDLRGIGGKEIRVKAGEPIKIEIPLNGTPIPTVTWDKDNKSVTPNDRTNIDHSDDKAVLHIPCSVRGDTGKYTITAKNEFGEDSGDIKVIVLDKPSKPQDLSVKEMFADHCTLSWKPPQDDGGADISGYVIERMDEDDGYWTPLPDVISGTSHAVKGLKKGKKYKFRVKAENIYGLSDPAETDKALVAKNPYDKPEPPGKPEVTDSGKDFIAIKWDPPKKDGGSPITGYNIERKDPKTGKWTKVNHEPLKKPEFVDKRVQDGKEYEYRVTAENAGGESDPSEVSNLIKAKPLKAPPKLDMSALGGREIRVRAGEPLKIDLPIDGAPTPTVTWTKDGKDLPESDRIQLGTDEDKTKLLIPIAKRDDTGKYAVTVSNPFGQDTGLINVIVLDKPGVPENLQASDIHADHCKLSWQPPADDGGGEISGYIVEKCEEGSNRWEKVPGIVNGTSHAVKDLEPGKKYKFRVKAENLYGIGDPIETDRSILAKNPYDPPGEPRDVEIPKYDKSSVTLKWKAPTDDGGNPIQGYQIEKMPAHGRGNWTPVNASPVSGTTFTVPNLIEGSEWEFRVVAVNDAGPGKPSKSTGVHKVMNPVFAAGPPGTPAVTGTSPTSVSLAWEKPTNDGGGNIEGYIVEVKKPGEDWKEVNPFPVKDTAYTVPGLKEGEEYQFRVKAVNEAGPGAPSQATQPVVAEKPRVKPSIDMSQIKDIKVRAGQDIKIAVPIKGWPIPTTTWELGTTPLDKGGRNKIETTENQALLVVSAAERKDTGPYTLRLKNDSGVVEGTINVIVLDKPSAPQGPLEVLDTKPTEITLAWKPPKDNGGSPIEHYVLEKKPKGSSKWQKVPGHIGPNDTQATAKNLEPGEEYDFRVVAVNENGESDPLLTSGPIKAKHPFDPPGKPGDPECVGTTEDSITLSWDPPTRDGGKPIKGYILEKKEKDGKRWVRVTPNEIADTEFTVKGLVEGKPYEFRVAAVNEAGPGQFAQTSQAIQPAPPPAPPKALMDPSLSEVTAKVGEPFRVRIPFKGSPVPTASWFNGPKEIGEDGRITFEQHPDEVVLVCRSALKSDQGNYSVVLKNPKGSDTARVNVIVLDKPSAPEGPLDVSKVTADGCKLSWNPPKDTGGKPLTHYVVEKKDKSTGKWTPVSKFCRDTECDVTGLDEGEQYEFRVAAVNDVGESEPLLTTKPITAKHPFDPPGKTGTPVIEDVDEDSVVLSWAKPKDDGGDKIKGYVVEVKEAGTGKWKPLNEKAPCKDTNFTATGLDKGKEYEFRVLAKNQAGLGEPSAPSKSVVTKAKPTKASAPRSLAVDNVGPHSMDLSWTKPWSDGGSPIKGYQLEKKTPGGKWEKVNDAPIFGETATVPNLEEGQQYEYRVAAITDAGVGDYSTATSPVTAEKKKHVPGAPENLQASDVKEDGCKLAWLPPSDNGGAEIMGYVVEKCEEGSNVWEKVPGIPGPDSHTVKGLEPGKKYKFRVKAENKLGFGEPCETNKAILAKNPYDAPGEPRDCEIAKYDRSSVTLKWKAPNDDGGNPIQGYIVEKMPKSGRLDGNWTPVTSVPVSGTSFTVPNLAENSEWDFRVTAVNDAGPGKPSKSTGPHKVRDPISTAGPPSQPRVDKVTPNSVSLSWDKPVNDGGAKIEGYIVEVKPKDGDWTEATTFPVKDTEFTVPKLKEGEEYQFRVKAVNEAGPGAPSTATGPVVAEKPTEKPSIDVSGIRDIKVHAGQPIKISIPIKGWPLPTTSWELGDTPLERGGRNQMDTKEDCVELLIKSAERKDTGPYTVRLRNPAGTAEAKINVIVLDKPSAPEGPLEAIDTRPDAITLQWKPPKDDGGAKIERYVLEKKPKGSNKWQKVPGLIGPNDTQATAKNLDDGEEYDFRVMAVNENGESEPLVTSGPIKAKFPFDVPGKPGDIECTGTTPDSITLAWEPPTRDGGKPIKGYVLEKREAGSKKWTRVTPHEIKDNEFTVKNLLEGHPYEFRVAAVNDAGTGNYAETSEAIKPAAPACAPKALLDALQSEITATVGEPYRIKIPFKGSPAPVATWFNGLKEIGEDGRITFEQHPDEVVLICRSALKTDEGNYNVTLKNPKGSDTARVHLIILDKPSSPEGPLEVSKVTADGCKLSWNPPKDTGGKPLTHYVVEKKDKSSGKWTPVSKFCRDTECDVTGLDEGEQYDFRVAAVNDVGESEPLLTSRPITAKHPFSTPGKSGAPKVDDVDEDSVTISWDKPKDDGGDKVKGYVVEVKEAGSGKWKPLNAKNPCKDTSFTASGLEKGKEYEFRVLAKNQAGLGEPSAPSQAVVTKAKASKASPPGGLAVDNVGPHSMDLSWTKPFSDGGSPIKGYQLEKKSPGGGWEKVGDSPIFGEKTTVPNLDEGQEYEYRVAAITDAGLGDYSNATPPVRAEKKKTVPDSPENLQASDIREDQCKLSWLPPSSDGGAEITGYLVEKCEEGSNLWEKVPGIVTKDSHVVKGLEPGKKYKFRVKAENRLGFGEPCETNKAILAKNPYDPPGEPRDAEIATYDKNSVTLKWKAPNDDGGNPIQGYIIEKMPKSGRLDGNWTPVTSVPVSGTSFTVPNLAENSEWDFRVTAVNDAGPGKPSKSTGPHKVRDPISTAGPPSQPRVDKVTPNSVSLSWDKPVNDGGAKIEGYIVEVKPKDGDWTEATPFPVKDTEFTVPKLKEGEEYQFRVKAVNEAGPGSPSTATGPVVAEKPTEKPSIDASGIRDIRVHAGQPIKISIPIKGWPLPTTTWELGDTPLERGGRNQMDTKEDCVELLIKSAERKDTGPYTVRLRNPAGTAEAKVNVIVLDKPSSPEGPLEAIDTRPDAITLQWKPPKDDGGAKIERYVLEKKPKGSNKWQKVPGHIGPNDTQATAKNLDDGEEYDFRVIAVNENGESEPLLTSGPIKAKFPFDVPGKPGTPECTGTTSDSITLSWEPPTRDGGKPIKGYVIEKRDPGGRWTKVTPHEVKGTEFTVKNLIERHPYEFRVAAVNDAGVGGFAETSEAIKPSAPLCAPKALLDALQSDITAVVGEPFKIKIPFKGSPIPIASWFNGGQPISENDRIRLEVGDGEVTLICKAAQKDDQGRYSINLKNPKGSDTAYVNVNVVDKPGTPEGPLEVSKITPDSCKLSWKPPKSDGGKPISHYLVEKRDKKSGKWTPVSKFCRDTECDVGDLEEGEQYDFRISAVNAQGAGEPLVTDKPITAKHQFNPPGKCGAPVAQDVDEDSVVLSWTKPSDDGGDKVRGYVVEVREKGSSKWKPLNEKNPCLDNKFTVNDLEKGKEYEFRVRAKNRAGLGDPSQPSEAIVPKAKASKASPPGLPNIDKIGKNFVDLTWTKPRLDGGSPVKGYQVEKRKPGGNWEKATDFPVSGESATIPNLEEGEEYEFRVAAITDAGVGDFSLNTMPVKVYERKAARLPEFVKRPDDVTVPTGEDAKFQVIVDGEPKPEIKWYMDGIELKNGAKYRISDDGEGKGQLVVKGVTKDDAGDITCEVFNSKGKDTAVARLRVQTPPQMEKELREQQVNKGETLKLKIPFSGTGPFSFKLKKDNREVSDSNDRVKLIPFDDYVILQIKDADKDDTGKYKVEISNDSGTSTCDVPIKVKALPGKCGPLQVSDVTKNSCHLKWKAPEDDGGSKITHYIVERQETGKPYWTTVASFQKDIEMDVQGLVESKEYLFRVAAANANGEGEFIEAPSAIIAKMPFDPPGPPGEPTGTEVGGDFVSLTWERPRSDGGGRILGYYIEKKEANADNWSRVNLTPHVANIFNVTNLIEDREYDFRVFAVNEAGESQPTGTGRRIKIKDPKAPTMPEIVHPLKSVTCAQGKSARFEVTVRGQPQPEITWSKGMRELSDSDKFSMSKEGEKYILVINNVFGEDADEYCVKASNAAGHKTSRADLIIKSPPKAHVPPRFLDTAMFEKSEDVVIKIPFTGNPKPRAMWLRESDEIKNSDKYKVEVGDRHAILTIRKADRTDDGPYRLQLENDLGSDSAIIKIAVNDVPDPPRYLNVDSVFHDSVMLTWKPPLNDGGGFITQYIVEKLEQGMANWIRCGATRFTFSTIEQLSPSHDYQFRVIAENLYGRSDPCEPTSLIKTVTEEEGRAKKGLGGFDDEGRRKRSKYTGPKPDNYDRLYHNIWDKEKPQPVDPIKYGSIHDYYDICEELGTGAFGVVHRAVEKSTGRNFVAKFINTQSAAEKNTVKAEIGIMNQLHHQNLLNLHDAFEDQHEMILVLEYLSGGELFDQIAEEDYKMTEAEVIHYIKQVCDGLCHMHEQNIVHLDVKPENILCTTKKSRDVKLVDFGLSAKLDPEQIVKVSTATADFASPEIADHEAVGFYTDMWAVGVLSYVLLSGLSPFAGSEREETLENVRKCSWKFDSEGFRNISDIGRDFISKLLIKNPTKRMTVHEALDHPWLSVEHPEFTSRIPASRYSNIRKQIKQKYADWPAPMPAIGRIANYSSLRKHRPKENDIYDSYFDRREAMPRFVRKPHACVVQEGNVANFKCKIIAGSPPLVTWHFKSSTLNPGLKYMPKYSGSNYELRIGRCKMEDKGEYVVKAVNSFGSKEECAFLGVEPATALPTRRAMSMEPTAAARKKTYDMDFEGYQEPPDKVPRFEFHLRDRFIQEGIGFKLLASVNGKPPPKISWSKDGKVLKKGDRWNIDYSLGICSLEISSCDTSDAGRYTCTAENEQGASETTCRVTVNGRKVYKPSALLDSSSLSSSSSSSYSSSITSSTYSHQRIGGGYRTTYRRTAYNSSSSRVS